MTGLYHLTDEQGSYYNLIYICGKPWITKNHRQQEAAIYTQDEMKIAKYHFSRKKIVVYESEVIKRNKKGNQRKKYERAPKIS